MVRQSMFWKPWHQSIPTYFQPSFSSSTWKTGGVWMSKLGVISQEQLYNVSQKVPTFKLTVTLSNLNRFSNNLHCWKAYEICYKTHLTLGMLLHYLGKLKVKVSANIQQIWINANKLHLLSLLTLLFIHKFWYFRCLRWRVFPILIASKKIFCVSVFFYLFTFAISLWHRKFVTADVTAVFVKCQQSTWHSATSTRFW